MAKRLVDHVAGGIAGMLAIRVAIAVRTQAAPQPLVATGARHVLAPAVSLYGSGARGAWLDTAKRSPVKCLLRINEKNTLRSNTLRLH